MLLSVHHILVLQVHQNFSCAFFLKVLAQKTQNKSNWWSLMLIDTNWSCFMLMLVDSDWCWCRLMLMLMLTHFYQNCNMMNDEMPLILKCNGGLLLCFNLTKVISDTIQAKTNLNQSWIRFKPGLDRQQIISTCIIDSTQLWVLAKK